MGGNTVFGAAEPREWYRHGAPASLLILYVQKLALILWRFLEWAVGSLEDSRVGIPARAV